MYTVTVLCTKFTFTKDESEKKIKENEVTSQTHVGIIGEIFIQSLTEAGSSFAQTTGEMLSEWNSVQPNSGNRKVGEIFIDEKIQALLQNEMIH